MCSITLLLQIKHTGRLFTLYSKMCLNIYKTMIQIQKRRIQIFDLKTKFLEKENRQQIQSRTAPLGQERDRRTLAANKSCMDKGIGR